MRLERLEIRRFRNVAPNTVLEFAPGFNVLLGKNASGKTTLLKLIAAVLRADLTPYAKEEFDLGWVLSHDGHRVKVSVRQWRPEEAPLEPDMSWDYRVDFMVEGQLLLYGANSTGRAYSSNPMETKYRALGPGFVSHSLSRASVRLVEPWGGLADIERTSARFDESLGGFAWLVGTEDALSLRFVGGRLIEWDLLPVQLAVALGEADKLSSVDHGELAAIASAIEAQEVVFFPQLLEDGHYRGFIIRVTFPGGRTVDSSLLSFGQKRMLSFLYFVASSPHIVIADELSNGLHWEWLQRCIEAIQDRQSFLTSQNPLLVDVLPLTGPEDVQKTFIQCHSVSKDGAPSLIWKHIDEQQARDVWDAYSAGVRQMGEILRSQGVW